MRRALLVFLALLTTGNGTLHAGEPRVEVPAGARIRLEADRTAWRLGENVIVRYLVENGSDQPFTVDWGGDGRAIRPIRNLVHVYDEEGRLLEDPWPDPACFGGPGGPFEVTMSTPLVIEIAVPRYRCFVKPGTYRIRVAHDLGWDVGGRYGRDSWMDGHVPADDDPRWVETTVELFEPPADRIDAILDVMEALPRRGDQTYLQRNRAWSDFETVRHPAYLASLVKRARARGSHEPCWLEGIRSIETPEATQALIELLSEETSERRAAALLERVPMPEPVPGLIDHVSPVGPDRSVQTRMVKRAWRDAFADPVRAWARANLGGRYAGRIPHHAAYFLASVGTPEDLPALVDGLDQALQYARADPQRQADPSERARLAMVYAAITHLDRRGARPPTAPESPVEIALALLWVKEHGAEALEAYEAQWPAWLGHEEIAIRDLAIRCLPRPLPEVALEHLETLVQDDDKQLRITALQAIRETEDARFRPLVAKELRAADDSWWLLTAEGAADAVGLDLVARARIHVAALADEAAFLIRFPQLLWVFEHSGGGSSGVPDAEERRRLKTSWTAFLDEHGDALLEGRRFLPTDPAVKHLIPTTMEVHPPRR